MEPINPQIKIEIEPKKGSENTHKIPVNNWERDALERVATAAITEQRKSRRWSIFFKILFFIYLFAVFALFFNNKNNTPSQDIWGNKVTNSSHHTALIRLDGVIAAGQQSNAESLSAALLKAAQNPKVKNILIAANSPGGSPVQSSVIFKTIRTIKQNYPDKKIVTSISDTCASGCYYIVSASDEIYADKSSVVGSIGVISQGFGYEEAAKKLGITPRTFTAGKYKDFMNSSRAVTDYEKEHMQKLLNSLHNNFIFDVKLGRGDKLSKNNDLFTGLFWDGAKSVELGLIDGIATPNEVAEKLGGYPVYDYTKTDKFQSIIDKLRVQITSIVSKSISDITNQKQPISFN